ncbi:p21-activated protein kinase-interacting protein 1-like [Anopheles ziemanni]|uniref:p21-activated protein kinase-interacting protein 1-like n=1 Tax=Anopheles coustani TaxID=139045 RepID=UPI0026582202|nr:p21-activated protein kinase-interacting protein 1-like [Anopheles coustani]XP_058171915.1 p21-activated protein kinase-interacting protein 1-like [Anopheles ziemanni]
MAGLEIVVGTYEQFTVCYRVEQLQKDPSKLYLKEAFAAHMHTASVRTIASNGKYVATGGADDRVCLLDVQNDMQQSEFLHHDGTVNTVAFSNDGSFLFTGGTDGSMAAINTTKQAVSKTWKGAHKTAVQSISIHPKGKMALSLGSDMVLKTWDLVTGRALFTTALHKNRSYGGSLTGVHWSPDGEHFALLGNKVVDVISIETTRSVRMLECGSKPTAMCWLSVEEIAVGLESGELVMANIHEETQEEKLQIYESRLKALSCLGEYIATASSAGEVSLWHLHGVDFTQICTQQIGCRPICLTLMNSGRYQLKMKTPEKGVSQKLPADNVGIKSASSSTIAKRIANELAWVSVETEDPVQLAASKQSQKGPKRQHSHAVRSKVQQGEIVKKKRPNVFVEESIETAVTLSTPDNVHVEKNGKGSKSAAAFANKSKKIKKKA